MNILRSIAAVLLGYIVFAVSTLSFFKIVHQAPHEVAPMPVMLGSIAVGIVAAFFGGHVAARIAGRTPLAHGMAVACILALGATASLISTLSSHGAIWSQVAALVLMAPSAAAGGWAVRSRKASSHP